MRCSWPADRKGSHKTMDCYRPVKTDTGTASFPKAKEYQKMRIGACDLEEDQQDLYTEGSNSEELRDSASEQSGESLDLESSSEMGGNWWESSLKKKKKKKNYNTFFCQYDIFSSDDNWKIKTAGQ